MENSVENVINLTKDEEFRFIVGVVFRNWTALQIGLNENNERVETIKSKVSSLLQTAIDGVLSIVGQKCETHDVADQLSYCIDDMFDVILDDDSDLLLVSHLLELYRFLQINDRAAIVNAMSQFQDRRHILSGEIYDPQKVVRKYGGNAVNSNGNNTFTVTPQPLLASYPSHCTESTPVSNISGSEYVLFQPSHAAGSTTIRTSKLDLPEGVENCVEMASSESDIEESNSTPTSESAPIPSAHTAASEEACFNTQWTIVGRRKKKK